jgi:hypothetical protein
MALTGWPKTLGWKHFKKLASSPRGATVAAHIDSHWRNPPGKQFRLVRDRQGWRLDGVNLVVSIDQNHTWVVRGQETPELLKHEQGHWDITGLIAREAYRAYEQLRARTPRALTEQLQHVQTRLQAKATRLNRKYDDETNHGVNLTPQQKWDTLTHNCLINNKNLPDN